LATDAGPRSGRHTSYVLDAVIIVSGPLLATEPAVA
jgi:hypothetical protein